jgi:hypothetical protein
MTDDQGAEAEAEPGASRSAPFDSVVGRMEAQLARGRPSGAVEAPRPATQPARIASPSADRDFVAGLCTGIAALATAMHLWLAYELSPLEQMYRDLPSTSQIADFAISAGWRYGSFGTLVALILVAYAQAPRRRWPLILVAIVAVSTLAFTYVVARLPVFDLAGSIRGG